MNGSRTITAVSASGQRPAAGPAIADITDRCVACAAHTCARYTAGHADVDSSGAWTPRDSESVPGHLAGDFTDQRFDALSGREIDAESNSGGASSSTDGRISE